MAYGLKASSCHPLSKPCYQLEASCHTWYELFLIFKKDFESRIHRNLEKRGHHYHVFLCHLWRMQYILLKYKSLMNWRWIKKKSSCCERVKFENGYTTCHWPCLTITIFWHWKSQKYFQNFICTKVIQIICIL